MTHTNSNNAHERRRHSQFHGQNTTILFMYRALQIIKINRVKLNRIFEYGKRKP